MPKTSLTDLAIKKLKSPHEGQETTWDTQVSGFGVRCSPGGTKTFVVMHGKRRRRVSIGRYPVVSLSAARQKAKEILYNAAFNVEALPSPSFDTARERYLKLREPELRFSTFRAYKRLLHLHFSFGETPVADITTRQVANALDRIEKPGERSHAYVALKVFFNWCLEREYCEANPMAPIRKPKTAGAKERVLSDDELTAVWRASQAFGKYGSIVRLLMTTGQRANQIASLQSAWVDTEKQVFNFPAEIMKNNRDHRLPYGELTASLLHSLTSDQGFYFSPPGLAGRPFSAWSKNKRKLDTLLPDMEPWTLHDLRRTWSTNAARLDVPPHITDRVLSHVTGSLSPVARVYNQYKYETAVREAVNMVEAHIQSLIEPDR